MRDAYEMFQNIGDGMMSFLLCLILCFACWALARHQDRKWRHQHLWAGEHIFSKDAPHYVVDIQWTCVRCGKEENNG